MNTCVTFKFQFCKIRGIKGPMLSRTATAGNAINATPTDATQPLAQWLDVGCSPPSATSTPQLAANKSPLADPDILSCIFLHVEEPRCLLTSCSLVSKLWCKFKLGIGIATLHTWVF